MNLKEALNVASEELMKTGSLDAKLEAEVLLRHVLKIDRAAMFRDLDEDISMEDSSNIASLVKRRIKREPLAYITGVKEFYGLPFVVSEDVLIPRQETELLVDAAIVQAKSLGKNQISIVDVGTGSGAIAVSLALNIPTSSIIAVDISEAALAIADDNRRTHGLYSRIKLRRGNLLEPIIDKIDILVSNLPYIRSDKLTSLQEEVLREPVVALDGGYDGLELIKRLLFQAVDKMSNPGVILFEIDPDQASEAVKLCQQFFPSAITTVLKDLSNNERAVLLEIR
ncbi:MAG: protein-(glutamine-N5) methyltransferase, release factor-specific [Chloroflexi bacterium]|nr:protein-(glutamine-N5) methyltransferase, release factor-specific [Chloroflexota bacterium]|tara:strand:+ start:1743 stop:2591 length:849 start_codon:yes stop_codon:yes gene_type:complete